MIPVTIWQHHSNVRVLIIAPAIGVSRFFYKHIAKYFHNRAYNVVTFDYPLKGDNLRLADWGIQDMTTVFKYVRDRFSCQSMYFLGHSMAGQLLPLAANHHYLEAAYLVATQNIWRCNWTGFARLKMALFWNLIIPMSLKTLGYLPGFTYGGRDLPGSIAKDWRNWAMCENGLNGYMPIATAKYQSVRIPVKFLSFADDPIAPLKSVRKIYDLYGTNIKKHEHLTPQELGVQGIGHFNFFRERLAFLWPKIGEWFDEEW